MIRLLKVCSLNNEFIIRLPYNDCRRFAGHSKWANIKHIKGLKDSQRAALFTKLSRKIRVAIQEGRSSDPDTNVQLAQLIEQAKKANMPIASIQNAIKQSKDGKDAMKSSIVELKGPGGCTVIINLLTENFPKSKQTLNTMVKKSKVTFSNGGQHLFSYKGVIEAELQAYSLEQAMGHALELDVEDVEEVESEEEKLVQFFCVPEKLNSVRKKLEDLKYVIRSCDCEYIPNTQVALSNSDLESVHQLYEKLQENPEVINIFDNIAWNPNK